MVEHSDDSQAGGASPASSEEMIRAARAGLTGSDATLSEQMVEAAREQLAELSPSEEMLLAAALGSHVSEGPAPDGAADTVVEALDVPGSLTEEVRRAPPGQVRPTAARTRPRAPATPTPAPDPFQRPSRFPRRLARLIPLAVVAVIAIGVLDDLDIGALFESFSDEGIEADRPEPAAVPVASPACPSFEGLVCDGSVTDASGVIANDAELEVAVAGVLARHGHEIAVVTVPGTGNRSAQQFAESLLNLWDVGDPVRRDGVVVLVDTEGRVTWIQHGPGLNHVPGDWGVFAEAGNRLFGSGDFDAGVLAILNALDGAFASAGQQDPAAAPSTTPETPVPAQTELRVRADTTLREDHFGTIVIAVDSVTLDCGGHTITGPGRLAGAPGIGVFQRTGVTVKNCVITNFNDGFRVQGSNNNTFANNTVLTVRQGFTLQGSDDNTLTGNHVTDANDFFAYGILDESDGNHLQDNTASGITGVGFYVFDSDNNTLTANSAVQTTGNGFDVKTSNFNVLTSNVGNENQKGFIVWISAAGNDLSQNTASGNDEGFRIESHNNTFTSNLASNNGYGFFLPRVPGNAGNSLTGNTANNNAQWGILDDTIGGTGDAGTNNHYSGNSCGGNGVGGSTPPGLC